MGFSYEILPDKTLKMVEAEFDQDQADGKTSSSTL